MKTKIFRGWSGFCFAIFLTLILSSLSESQISGTISRVETGKPQAGVPLPVRVELFQSSIIEKIEIAFRRFGEQDFRRAEMSLTGTTAEASLPGEFVEPPFIEYYFIVKIAGRLEEETYPLENPRSQPLRVSFESGETSSGKLIILSPDRDETIRSDELLISFSLANLDSADSQSEIRILFDGADLSSFMVRYGDLVILRPGNAGALIGPGKHQARVEVGDGLTAPKLSMEWGFTLEGPASVPMQDISVISPWQYSGSLKLETRQEQIGERTTPFNRLTASAKGSYKEFEVRGFAYLTNEEKPARQPQNRFSVTGESPWLRIGYGDVFPAFPDLIMNGKRVRGFFTNLTLKKFNLDYVNGSVTRKVEGSSGEPIPDSLLQSYQGTDPAAVFRFLDSLDGSARWVKVRPGTFSRDIMAIRPSFGPRDGSHWGITYLKSKDEINSIHYGSRPQENVVFGSDLMVSIDDRNLELFGQAAFSATNKDITNGSFSDEDIDSLFADSKPEDRDRMKQIRDYAKGLITVNENLIPLNMRHLPTLSYEAGLNLNYFNNNLRASYLRHGDGFESFGQSYIRNDVEGYSVSDRLNLLSNRLLVSAGYERVHDNTSYSKPATTTFSTINAGVSVYPVSPNIPNITVGIILSDNLNGLPSADTNAVVDESSRRFVVQFQKQFKYLIRHSGQLSISASGRDDASPRNYDTRNSTLGLGLTSDFDFPLQTIFTLNLSNSRYYSAGSVENKATYTSIYLSGQYRAMQDRLTLNGSVSPTFGDIRRILLGMGAQYYFLEYLSLQSSLNFYMNSRLPGIGGSQNDVIWTLAIRAEL